MSYPKFDDPGKGVDQKGSHVYAIPREVHRRAIQSVANRVVGLTAGGTAGTGMLALAGLVLGTTAGGKIGNAVTVVINGVQSAVIAQDNLQYPAGTQGTNTIAKYLVSTGAGTSGTITGPGNIVDKSKYATTALAIAAAKLPDLPDGNCALGFITLSAPEATSLAFGPSIGFVTGTGGTAGTATYTNLVCMPYDG